MDEVGRNKGHHEDGYNTALTVDNIYVLNFCWN